GPVATRKAFGDTLAWLVDRRPDLVVLDGEVGNSTYTDEAQAVAPERFVELYIAEGCMLGTATGLQALGKTAFAATFGAFWTRAATDHDVVTLIGAGITVHMCLAARDILGAEGISARVLDCYSVKPIDAETIRTALEGTDLLVVVEDHRIEGGLGDAVLDAIA